MLFTVVIGGHSWASDQIAVQSMKTGERRVLVQGATNARDVPTGHLVYARAGTLMAVPFDLGKLEVTGAPVPIVDRVRRSGGGASAQFNFSSAGTLIYIPGGFTQERTLVWADRRGAVQPLAAPLRDYKPADGSGAEERLIAGEGPMVPHSWSPDGRALTLSIMHPATRSHARGR